MSVNEPRILLSAGEPSADLHGARIVEALTRRWPGAVIEAVGGPRIEQAGARLISHIDDLGAIGLVEVVEQIPRHWRLLRELKARLASHRYDLVLPIDYPTFHLYLARAAKESGVPVLYYIAPQLWAWWSGRARRFAAAVDRMAVILPFEREFFESVGLSCDFVGHPLMDGPAPPAKAEARRRLGLEPDGRVLAVFPGSRQQEVDLHWESFAETAHRLVAEGECHTVLVARSGRLQYPDAQGFQLVDHDSMILLAAADAALVKSGTTTLEAALAGTPMVVAYRTNPVTMWLARRLVKVPWASLVNLVADESIVPEVLQEDLTSDNLLSRLRPLLDPSSPERHNQLSALAQVKRALGQPGAADRVADIAAELMDR